jgi:Fe-S oxidoreductase
MEDRKLFHTLLRSARWAQGPLVNKEGYIRHLPMIFFPAQDFRALPPVADKPFRAIFPKIKPQVNRPRYRIALFSGCVQDFVYPEQMEAAVELLGRQGVEMDYPLDQSCCGLPLMMLGEMKACKDLAKKNIAAMESSHFDYVLVGCASCGSFLKHGYQNMLAGDPQWSDRMNRFSNKVIDYSSFVQDILRVDTSDFKTSGETVTYHSPCHLCRGLGVTEAPREILKIAGLDYHPSEEEDVCCGFGGTFSSKFPEESAEILAKKLAHIEATGADMVVTDCPGCVMQIRGGAKKRKLKVEVKHIAEAVAEQIKK